VQAQPQPTAGRPRYAEPNQPQFGGGFIELLFGGAARQFVAPRAYQPALPDDRSQAAPAPVTLNMPVLNYAPSAFGNRAHPPVDPKFDRQVVAYRGEEKPGTIVIDTPNRFLYLVEGGGKAMRYGIGVGRPGFTWAGVKTITSMREWPDWRPPDEMIERRPDLPRYMAGGPENPLGALSRLDALPHPRFERAVDHRLAGILGLHSHAQRRRRRPLRSRESRHQGRGDVGLFRHQRVTGRYSAAVRASLSGRPASSRSLTACSATK
jgi:lipoprotein-anchoring transpeptidase ErfK/SrfK